MLQFFQFHPFSHIYVIVDVFVYLVLYLADCLHRMVSIFFFFFIYLLFAEDKFFFCAR